MRVRSTVIRESFYKDVTCAFCGCEYVYRMTRRAGSTTSGYHRGINRDAARDADEGARRRVARSLEKSTDPIPCPPCGKLQLDMIRNAKRTRLLFMVPLFLVGMVSFYSICDFAGAVAIRNFGIVAFGTLLILGIAWTFLQNMNADPQSRIGDPRAIPREEYQRIVEQTNRRLAELAQKKAGSK